MKTKDLSKEQLYEYFAEHVRYEIDMLLHATRVINQQLIVPKGIEFMPVESFTIHLRNLITFLYPSIPRDNDVCAKDFFEKEESWIKVQPKISITLKNAKDRVDKEMGHLTTLRQSGMPESKKWDVNGLTKELMSVIESFCQLADKVKLDTAIKPLLFYYSQIK